MKISNDTLLVLVAKAVGKYECKTEKFYSALMRIFIKYDLTQEQCKFLEEAKGWEE